MLNVFIPHRWNNEDYTEISALLDRTKFKVRDYSVPSWAPFDAIDRRYNLDPQLQRQIKYALSIGKPVVAVRITDKTSTAIASLGIPVVAKRKDALENWIARNT